MYSHMIQSQPAFVFAFALATWGSDPHFLKTATYSKVNWPLLAAPHQCHHCLLHQTSGTIACCTTPVAPLLAAPVPPLSTAAPRSCTLSAPTYLFMCPPIFLTLTFCYYFCCYILVLQKHLFCTAICRMSQLYPFVENCSQAVPMM